MTTRFEDRAAIRQREFHNGWAIKLCQEGKGWSVRAAQDGGETTSRFYFDLPTAERFYANVCRILQQTADRKINGEIAKYNK